MHRKIALCGFGVSNYYNKLKLILLEKQIDFREELVYPWQRSSFLECSPLGKIPFIRTADGCLSESQVILDYLEELYPERPMYPTDIYARAKCRELIQHLELNTEWVARRLYKEAFFGGEVSDETKREACDRLVLGLKAVAHLSKFSPYILGPSLTAADCAAYIHFVMIELTTKKIFGEDLLEQAFPDLAQYLRLMESRPHVHKMMEDRTAAMAAFVRLNVKYDG